MKNSTAPSSDPGCGRAYWRSLDEVAQTPEFRQWVEREFPQGASEWTDPISRRHFTKIMSASFLLAGLGFAGGGCRRPVEKLEPFGKMPEGYVHGLPEFYATAMPTQGGAIPLVAKSNDGRPTKLEGNALHPDSNGGTDRFVQASILNLYDPDRATRFTSNGQNSSPEGALDFLSQLARRAQGNAGQGLSFLVETNNSPSRLRLQKLIAAKLPQARWHRYDPIDMDVHRRAASQAFGQSVKPYLQLDKADVIVSLDCDFLGSEEDQHNHIRRFSSRRALEKPGDSLNRLYLVESLMSVTGFNADHRLRVASSAILQVAAALAAQILNPAELGALSNLGQPTGIDPNWITECAKDLLQNRGKSLVLAGHRQPMAVHLLAHALNAALGNVGQTVLFQSVPEPSERSIAELARDLKAGRVDTLLILGGNPVYSAPADLDWANTQRKAKLVARLGYYEDETFPFCDWHLPAAHYLESWGDALTSDGSLVPIQPLIAPLFGGLTELEVLARVAGEVETDAYSIVRKTFSEFLGGRELESAWRKFLHDGFLQDSAAKPVSVKFNPAALGQGNGASKVAPPSREKLEVIFHRHYCLDDGRYNNNGWLQELPDPATKLVWDNAVLVSRKTAAELGFKNSDLVEIQAGGRSVQGPIWVQPGMADYTLGLALGYGRTRTGRVGAGTGFNFYALRGSDAPNFTGAATVRLTGATYRLVCTQNHWSMEGRPIIREANLEQYRKNPRFAKNMEVEESEAREMRPMYPNPFDQLKQSGVHQWGMSIDLNRCVGCAACMVACQSENNVPIVGKEQVHRGREMHWLRIDRYYTGRAPADKPQPQSRADFFETFKPDQDQQYEEWIENPQVVNQPMLCQHCEAAPCENVCPVNATSHDQEGLNVMTYNRCVGTRYCSNNCPYKVRRFNYFDYNKRPIGKFYLGPFGHRKDDEWDLMKMIKNPDVTVRMRGVMEKCTYCLQRIEQAKIAQKIKAGTSADIVVPSDSFTTACAQACPAGAIVFGNLKDSESRVSKLKALDRNYSVLEALYTKPRTTYLARIRNPNPKMPDHYGEAPLSLREYDQKHGDPFEEQGERPRTGPAEKGGH